MWEVALGSGEGCGEDEVEEGYWDGSLEMHDGG
jgi:hypothetical protein